MAKAPDDDFSAETTHGGGEGIRALDFLLEKEALDRYLDLLAVKNLSVSYIEGNQRFGTAFVNTYPALSSNIALPTISLH